MKHHTTLNNLITIRLLRKWAQGSEALLTLVVQTHVQTSGLLRVTVSPPTGQEMRSSRVCSVDRCTKIKPTQNLLKCKFIWPENGKLYLTKTAPLAPPGGGFVIGRR